MQQYGKTKFKRKVAGHGHECSICVPDIDSKTGRHRARQNAKLDINNQLEDQDEPVHVNIRESEDHL